MCQFQKPNPLSINNNKRNTNSKGFVKIYPEVDIYTSIRYKRIYIQKCRNEDVKSETTQELDNKMKNISNQTFTECYIQETFYSIKNRITAIGKNKLKPDKGMKNENEYQKNF